MRLSVMLLIAPLLLAGGCQREANVLAPPEGHPALQEESTGQIEPGVPEVTPDQMLLLNSREARLTIIDVRRQEEFALGHLPDAVNMPIDELPMRLDDLPRDSVIVTSCAGGSRSSRAAAMLRSQGYDVRGYCTLRAWHKAGHSIEMR